MTDGGRSADPGAAGLKAGSLGALAVTFFVVSAAGPLVAMAGGIPVAMLFGNGPGIPALFLATTLILCVFAVGYTAMARHVQNAGAFYAYAGAGLGARAGAATGVVALLSYNAMQIGLYGMFGVAADALLAPAIGISLPWWAYAAAALASIATLGYRQVDLSARVLGVLVAGEYLIVLALDAAIMAQGGDAGLSARPFAPDVVLGGAPWIGLMLCFSAFMGFEATTIYGEEARDPARTVPLATFASVLLIGGFYTLSTWAAVVGAGVEATLTQLEPPRDPTQFLFSLSDRYVGPPLTLAMRVLFVTSIYASLLAFHNAIARYFFAMGRDNVLPAVLGRSHARFQSPHRGSLLQTALAAACLAAFAVAGADPILVVFTLPSALGTLGIILLMAIASASILRFFRKRGARGPATVWMPLLALLALAGVAVFATVNFEVLAGGESAVSRWLPLTLPAAAIVGGALVRRRTRAG